MYNNNTLSNYIRKMNKAISEFNKADVKTLKVSISKGNRKIGKVLNVSLPPIVTCANCKECKSLCYDIKACMQYSNVINARAKNLVILRKDREKYFSDIDETMSKRKKNKYLRFHVAGDILDIDYLQNVVNLAKKHNDFIIWTYTKNYNVVNEWIAQNGVDALPANLTIMFSEWRGLEMENPYKMPEFRVVFKTDEHKPDPKKVYYCPGNCDICKACGRGCINHETVYCNEH